MDARSRSSSGEARYAGGEGAVTPKFWHWKCHEKWIGEAKEALLSAPKLIKRARRLIQEIEEDRG